MTEFPDLKEYCTIIHAGHVHIYTFAHHSKIIATRISFFENIYILTINYVNLMSSSELSPGMHNTGGAMHLS